MEEGYLGNALSMEVDMERRGVHTEMSSSLADKDLYIIMIQEVVTDHER